MNTFLVFFIWHYFACVIVISSTIFHLEAEMKASMRLCHLEKGSCKPNLSCILILTTNGPFDNSA